MRAAPNLPGLATHYRQPESVRLAWCGRLSDRVVTVPDGSLR